MRQRALRSTTRTATSEVGPVSAAECQTICFKEVDVIVSPTTPTTAFGIGAKTQDPVSMYLSDIYTISANLAGLPGISIPAGFADDLPVGIQLLGPHFEEAKILNAAHQFQQHTDFHSRIPEAFASNSTIAHSVEV